MKRPDGSYRKYAFCSDGCKFKTLGQAKNGVSAADLRSKGFITRKLEELERQKQEAREGASI